MLKMKNNNYMQLLNEKNGIILERVVIADNFSTRLKGLMGKKSLGENDGLLIKPCNSIHTFFMKFNIDVVFIDKNNRIISIYRNMLPWKFSKIYFESQFCIEGNKECFKDLKIGDKINIIKKLDFK